jgi:DNA-binding NarL/FixJ family response regulator
MLATLLFHIEDDALRAKLVSFLEGEKYTIQPDLTREEGELPSDLAKRLISSHPDVVVMDYVQEDAFSVKVLQSATDQFAQANFVFVDPGSTDMENIIMAFNEGARGFLRKDATQAVFLTTLSRAFSGPARWRSAQEDDNALEKEIHRLGQKIARGRASLTSSYKLISYLLSTPLNLQPRKVLILSDSSYQRELLKKIMEDANFLVSTAATTDEAVTGINEEKPRIIISDYGLNEGKTGVDFCREVKFVHKYGPCFFVVCTADEDKLPVIMAPGNGVDDCLLKPSTDSSISEFIARVSVGLII